MTGSPTAAPATLVLAGEARLLGAVAGQPVDATPVWFMRQAGGSLPGYLSLRERHSVEEIARQPELCAQVSCMPVDVLGVDAAVMFADIMLPLVPMGIELSLTPAGPVIAAPLRSAADVERLRPLEPEDDIPSMLEAIRLVRAELRGRAAVIGICGGPFTLACYLIEGGPSRDQIMARGFMYREPAAWHDLMRRLTRALCGYAQAQVTAGAQVVQVFDSWAGALGPDEYERFVGPYAQELFRSLHDVPTIHFAAGSAGILEKLVDAGGDVIGIDHRQSLAAAWPRLGDRGIQGNLDPARLSAGFDVVATGADQVIAEAAGRPGHIFNLGHAAPRDADPALMRELAAYVHEATARA